MKTQSSAASRLYYLDWLRVLAILGVFFFHNARFYDQFSDWHVKNATTNLGASALVAFMVQWIMPLFFLISGAGTYYALKSRSVGKFIHDRGLRLFVPLVFGMLVIVMPQAYFQALSHGEQLGQYNLFQIYGLYLTTLPDLNWFHLWFLAYLFLFTIVASPLFLVGKNGTSVASRISGWLGNPWLLLVLAVFSVAAANSLIYPGGFWGHRDSGGWNVVNNFLFFLFGFLVFANQRIVEAIKRLTWLWVGGAVVALAVLLGLFVPQLAEAGDHFGSAKYVLANLVQALNTWFWLFAIVSLAARFLNKTNRFLVYGNEAVLPFYILHQTVIISIGYYVVQWSAGVGVKYLVISTTSFVAIMVLYELVRRLNVLRFLFGMRLARSRRAEMAREVER